METDGERIEQLESELAWYKAIWETLPVELKTILGLYKRPVRLVTRSNQMYFGILSGYDFSLESLAVTNEHVTYDGVNRKNMKELNTTYIPKGSLSFYEAVYEQEEQPDEVYNYQEQTENYTDDYE